MTDDFDRRVLNTYIGDTFRDEALDIPFYKSVPCQIHVHASSTLRVYTLRLIMRYCCCM